MSSNLSEGASGVEIIPSVVTQLRLESQTVLSVELAAVDGSKLPKWTPGSHIDLHLPNGHTRQYSLCGDLDTDERYRIAVLREPVSRGGSEYVHMFLRPGQRVGVTAPRNHFPLEAYDHVSFIAGGIGITPLIPMLEALGYRKSWHLYYSGRSDASMAFVSELTTRYPNRVSVTRSDLDGRLDLSSLVVDLPSGSAIYSCGPPSLLDALSDLVKQHQHIPLHTERFKATPKAHLPNSGHTVHCARSGVAVWVPPEKSFLAALREAEVPVASSCSDGLCGTCEVRVLSGKPEHRDDILSGANRESSEIMYVCVSRGVTDELVLDI